MQCYILLNTIDKVKDFVRQMDHLECHGTISDDTKTVNVHSIMGIFSCNLIDPLLLSIDDLQITSIPELQLFLVPEQEVSYEEISQD